MSIGILASLNPISGVYAYMMGGLTGAFFTSSVIMSIQATSAMALIVADTPAVTGGGDTTGALVVLGLLTGLVMILLGVVGLGQAVRFIPQSVMLSFTSAVAILIILGQLEPITGYESSRGNKVAKAWDTFHHVTDFDSQSIIVAGVTVGLLVVLQRTRFSSLALLAAIVGGSLLPRFLDWDTPTVGGIYDIPSGLPTPVLPALGSVGDLIGPAVALALVGLVQGAVISREVPNPDGARPDPSGDFTGQGIANLVSAVFRGMPVGGSFSATGILVAGGARTRLANVVSAVTIACALVVFKPAAEILSLPAIAGFLTVVGLGILKPSSIVAAWRLDGLHRYGMVALVATALIWSLQAAVLAGAVITMVLYVVGQSNSVELKEQVFDGRVVVDERELAAVLPPHSVVIVRHYGSLFYASADSYFDALPRPEDADCGSAVILYLRGQRTIDSSVLAALVEYRDLLEQHGCRLVLVGLNEETVALLNRSELVSVTPPVGLFGTGGSLNDSLIEATTAMGAWIEEQSQV